MWIEPKYLHIRKICHHHQVHNPWRHQLGQKVQGLAENLTSSQLTKFVIAKICKDFIKTNGRKLRHFVSLFIILKKKKNIFLHYKQEFVGKNVDLPLTMSFIYLN